MRVFVAVRFLIVGGVISFEALLLILPAVEVVFVLRSFHGRIGLFRLWVLVSGIRFHSFVFILSLKIQCQVSNDCGNVFPKRGNPATALRRVDRSFTASYSLHGPCS